jgi:hypothetical protein
VRRRQEAGGRRKGDGRQGDGKKVRSTQGAVRRKGEWKVNVRRGEPCVRPNRNEQEEKKETGEFQKSDNYFCNYSGAFLKNQNYEFKKFKRFKKLQAVSVQVLNF